MSALRGIMLVTLSLLFPLLGFAQLQATPTWQRKAFPHSFEPSLRSFPEVSDGYIWSYRRLLSNVEPDTIRVTSIKDGSEFRIPFWLEQAAEVWIDDVYVAQTKKVFVVGSYLAKNEALRRNFLATVDLQGKLLQNTNLGDYEAERVCGANDGTIWAVGQVWNDEMQGKSYPLLRGFTSAGKLVHTYIERSELAVTDLNLSYRVLLDKKLPRRAFVSCSGEYVGVYIGPAFAWFELQRNSGKLASWRVDVPPGRTRITGLAFLGHGQVYASFKSLLVGNPTPVRSFQKLNFGNDGTATWERTDIRSAEPADPKDRFVMLLGSDGASLVYAPSLRNYPNGDPFLSWVRPY